MDELEKMAQDAPLNALFNAAKPFIAGMEQVNAGILKITPTINDKKYISIIIVRGAEEVADVCDTLDALEKVWERSHN